jgi:UDP-N-acetylmuramate--alanine ligase
MHIFFSGIGGVGIGPAASIAHQAGYQVSGSDARETQYLEVLKQKGIDTAYVGQTAEALRELHTRQPIDWYVYSSAVKEDNPELKAARELGIKTTKRDEFLNHLLSETQLKLIAIAGTHGKTTTTAMVIWLFKSLGIPVSYSVGAKLAFGEMGEFDPKSEYFVYECDEFDRNFLAFHPYLSLISGVSYDHHEIYPTREDYKQAFRDFIGQSKQTIMWQEDYEYLQLEDEKISVLSGEPELQNLPLAGKYNRRNACLAVEALRTSGHLQVTTDMTSDFELMGRFPGLHRRMEQIIPNLYTDEAHTPDKIRGCMSVALEVAQHARSSVVVVYEPLTNRRQHYMKDDYQDCFAGAKKVYWLPSYLAREDPEQSILTPEELVSRLTDPSIAEPRTRDEALKQTIQQHLDAGDMVVAMAGGGGGSLDEWARANFVRSS